MKSPKTRFAPQRWWNHPKGGSLWSLATHPAHDALLVGSVQRPDSLWLLDGAARCVGDAPDELRAAAWADANTAVLVVEARASGASSGPVRVVLRDVTGVVPDRVVATLPLAGHRCNLTVDRAGRRAVVNSNVGVHLVDLGAGGARIVEAFDGDRAGVICGALSPDGRLVLAARGSVDGVRRYDADTGARVGVMGGDVTNGVVAMCFDPTGALAAASTLSAPSLVVWNILDGTVRFVREGSPDRPPALAFSPDGTLLALSEHGGHVTVLDTRDGRVVHTARSLDGYALRLAFARDGGALFAADGGEVHVFPVGATAPARPTVKPAAPREWETLLAGNHVSYLTGGCVDAAGRAWLVGQSGRVLASTDDATWEPVKLARRPYLHGACAEPGGAVHLYGEGVVVTTSDGDLRESRMRGKANVVTMAASATVTVAAGYNQLFVLDRATGAWASVKPAALEGGWHHELAVDARGVFFLASGSDEQGFVAAWDGAGEWRRLALDDCGAMWCVACAGDDVYAGGAKGALFRSADGGAHWERRPSPSATATWRALVARGAVVYAAGDDDAVYRSDDRGQRWERVLRAEVRKLVWTPRGRVVGVGSGPVFGCVEEVG